MGVAFMHNVHVKEDDLKKPHHMPIEILVDNKMPMYPKAWEEGATVKNWLRYTIVHPKNVAADGID